MIQTAVSSLLIKKRLFRLFDDNNSPTKCQFETGFLSAFKRSLPVHGFQFKMKNIYVYTHIYICVLDSVIHLISVIKPNN